MDNSPTGPIRVLHVDDDPDVGDLTATFLEREDDRLAVETATRAAEGLDRLAAAEFDCVVSDYDMPALDGIDFLERVRERDPDLPFILFTGKGSEEVASEAVSAGVTEYLQKEAGTEQYTLLANRIVQAVSGRRAEVNYREIFEKATDGILVHDPETGEVLDANQRYCEMNGYSRDEVVGMGIEDFSWNEPPYTGDEGRRRIQDAVEGESQVFEWVNETKSGGRLPVEVHLKHTTIGGRDRVLALVRDTSERKERERELERYEAIVENIDEGIYVFDAEGRVEFVNSRVADISGVPRSEWAGEPVSAHAERGALTETEVAAVECGIETVDGGEADEVRIDLGPDLPGGARRIELRLTTLDPDGEADRVLGYSRDVTESRRREQQLEALFDNAPVAVAYTEFEEGEPIVRDVNEAFERTFGYGSEAAAGRRIDDLVVPDGQAVEAVAINERVREGEQFGVEVRREAADGTRDFLLYSVPLRPGESGERSYAMYSDITERNEYKRQLERQNDRLDEFAGFVSHDLRNPLNVAAGSLELARDECESRHLDDVEAALDRMASLIDDVLAYTRAGASTMEPEAVDLRSVVEECWQHVDAGSATVVTDADRAVWADEERLRVLVENLLANAVEHGGGDVSIRVGELETGFFVADDGPGVPPDERERVFERGYSTADDGHGFGLSIVEEVAEAHDWAVTVTESEAGGTRFEITGVEPADR